MSAEETLISVGSAIVSAILVVVQAILVYRIDKSRMKFENYLGVSEKTELEIKAEIEKGSTNEIITITNRGLIPIDEFSAAITAEVQEKGFTSSFVWERKTLLGPKEIATIPLYEKLAKAHREKNLIKLCEGMEIPMENPDTGEEVLDTIYVGKLEKPFSLILDVQIHAKIQDLDKSARKKFRLSYRWRYDGFDDRIDDDYVIHVYEHMGEWKT